MSSGQMRCDNCTSFKVYAIRTGGHKDIGPLFTMAAIGAGLLAVAAGIGLFLTKGGPWFIGIGIVAGVSSYLLWKAGDRLQETTVDSYRCDTCGKRWTVWEAESKLRN